LGARIHEGAPNAAAKSIDAMEDEGRVPGPSEFGTLLRHYRLAAGLSQEALAERARMSTNGVGALERGYRRSPQRETLALLAEALKLDHEQRREFEAAAARSEVPRRIGAGWAISGPLTATAISNLPIALTSFVGREHDVVQVKNLVNRHRLLTLVGSGGVGKTRLALHVGSELLDRYPDGVWFVDLAPITEPELVANVIAQSVGMNQQEGRRVDESILRWLKRKRLLLILDNCEHLLVTVASIAGSILNTAPDVRILATSRQAFNIGGEVAHRLPSLSIPSEVAGLKMAEALQYGAVALFVDRAYAVDTRFEITDDSAPTVADICRRLDGIPLAIELAAARVNVLSIPNLAQRLNERFKILTGGSRTALPRQKTLGALIDWSYDLLTAQEQVLFARLGIFAGGFGLDAATAVGGADGLDEVDVFDLLASVTDKSLVVADVSGGAERYRLLESTAAYALGKLAASGDRERLARRHAEYFRDQAEAADKRRGSEQTMAWLAGVELELDNYRAALEWALTDDNDAVLGGAILGALRSLWSEAGLRVEGRYWIERALPRISETEQPAIAARLHLALSALLSGKRYYEAAQRAMQLYESMGDRGRAAHAQRSCGSALFQMGQLEAAREAIAHALAASRACADTWNVAYCLKQLAGIEWGRGDFSAGRELFAQALADVKALGDELRTAYVLGDIAELEFAAGDPAQALRLATEALEIHVRGKNATNAAIGYNNIAAYRIALGDVTGARDSAREGLRLAGQIQDEQWAAIALQHLALLAALDGDSRRAAQLVGYVNALFDQIGTQRQSTEQWGYDKLLATLRGKLSEGEIKNLAPEGAAWSEDHAVEEALKV
jgi:predicted ATPase/transcriptional regulator with XRE-family HTH domain